MIRRVGRAPHVSKGIRFTDTPLHKDGNVFVQGVVNGPIPASLRDSEKISIHAVSFGHHIKQLNSTSGVLRRGNEFCDGLSGLGPTGIGYNPISSLSLCGIEGIVGPLQECSQIS